MYSSTKTKWNKVSRQHRCPICGRPDWCLYTGPGDAPDAVICARVQSDRRVGTKGAGWLHRLRDSGDSWRTQPRRVTVSAPAASTADLARMASACYTALGTLSRAVHAAELGVSADALDLMRVGWSAQHRATTWPMFDGAGNMCGIRLRAADGRKWAVRGSRSGLFVAQGPTLWGDGHRLPGTLVIVEGATDAAAMLTLGIECYGRPSCTGGTEAIVEFCAPERWNRVAIFADADTPGQRGAHSLAARLVGYVPDGVRIVTPPAKDVREWVRAGATRDDLARAVDAAPLLQLRYGVKGGAR